MKTPLLLITFLLISFSSFSQTPDVNTTQVGVQVSGDVSTNDPTGSSGYGTPVPDAGNPDASVPVMNANGTYTFVSPVAGVFTFQVPSGLDDTACQNTVIAGTQECFDEFPDETLEEKLELCGVLEAYNACSNVSVALVITVVSNNALNFQSSESNLVSIPDNAAFDFSVGFTMEAWIKPSVFTASRTVFSQYSSNQRAFAIITKDTGAVEITISTNGSDEVYYITANALTLDTWQHIALTYDGASIQFYINGIEAGMNGTITGTLTGAMHNSTAPILLGSRSSAIFYEGDMDEVRIWTRALTTTEVNDQLYENLPSDANGLVAYYKMDQGISNGDNTAITTLTDNGVNGLNGTLTNFTRTGTISNFVEGVPLSLLSVDESIFNASEMPIVYPNPINNGVINVKISNTLLVNNKKLTYKIYNTVGGIIKEGVLTNTENQISIGYLASGIYMIRISSNGNSVIKKLIVR